MSSVARHWKLRADARVDTWRRQNKSTNVQYASPANQAPYQSAGTCVLCMLNMTRETVLKTLQR